MYHVMNPLHSVLYLCKARGNTMAVIPGKSTSIMIICFVPVAFMMTLSHLYMLAEVSPPPNLWVKSLRLAALSSILWRRRDSVKYYIHLGFLMLRLEPIFSTLSCTRVFFQLKIYHRTILWLKILYGNKPVYNTFTLKDQLDTTKTITSRFIFCTVQNQVNLSASIYKKNI